VAPLEKRRVRYERLGLAIWFEGNLSASRFDSETATLGPGDSRAFSLS
jgi:hypothetical protein